MTDQELLQMMVAEPWDAYHRADYRKKLDLLRHSFSMYIPHADREYEFLHIVLDDRAELEYSVNKSAVIGDNHSMKDFVRFVFALGEGETKTFAWATADGIKEWILSRDRSALYIEVPEFGEGFFIRYWNFRDECFAAYEKRYGWGYKADIRKIEVPATDYDFLQTLDVQDEFELVRFLDDGQSFETTDVERLLQYVDEQRMMEKSLEAPDDERLRSLRELNVAIRHY